MRRVNERSPAVTFDFVLPDNRVRGLRHEQDRVVSSLSPSTSGDIRAAAANAAGWREYGEDQFRLTLLDRLTGLGNRDWALATLGGLHRLRQEAGFPVAYTVLLTDGRGTKAANDLYGHDLGNVHLQLCAKGHEAAFGIPMASTVSVGAARYGGDEFMQILVHMLSMNQQASRVISGNQDSFHHLMEIDAARVLEHFHTAWIEAILEHPNEIERAQILSVVANIQQQGKWLARFGAATYPFDVRDPDDPSEIWTAAETAQVTMRLLEGSNGNGMPRGGLRNQARIPLLTTRNGARYRAQADRIKTALKEGRDRHPEDIASDQEVMAALAQRPELGPARDYRRALDWLAQDPAMLADATVALEARMRGLNLDQLRQVGQFFQNLSRLAETLSAGATPLPAVAPAAQTSRFAGLDL